MAVIRPKKYSNKSSSRTSLYRWIIALLLLVVFVRWVVKNVGSGVDSQILASVLSASDHVMKLMEPIMEDTGTNKVKKYPPLSCRKFLELVQQNKSIQDPNQGQILSTTTSVPPTFEISVHNSQFDPAAWHIYEKGIYFETELVRAFSKVLNSTAKSTTTTTTHVLDVGGHIGYFSLLAAAHGNVVVDAFEPNLKNSLRFCESMRLNHWTNEYESSSSSSSGASTKQSHINWHPYATGRTDGTLVFQEHYADPGQGKIVLVNNAINTAAGYQMHIVTLDNFAQSRGWFTSKPDIAIFKVDVDGYEAHVMEGAKQLLNAHLIRNIFMEAAIRTAEEVAAARTSLLVIAEAGYKVHQYGDDTGPQAHKQVDWTHLTQPQHIASQVIAEAAKDAKKFLNVWWTLP